MAYADKTHHDYAGRFVYSDDGEDLKRHPFFCGIPWDNMQDYYPPFVPRLQNWEDTKYFDDEGPISDIDSTSSDAEFVPATPASVPIGANNHHQEAQGIIPSAPLNGCERKISPLGLKEAKMKKAKERKRPRDKILRDANCSRMALRMRKDSAFIGYGYRRGKTITDVIEEALNSEGSSSTNGFTDREQEVEVTGRL